jgi:hypothetical protein
MRKPFSAYWWLAIVFFWVEPQVVAQSNKRLEYEAQKGFIIEQYLEQIAENSENENLDFITLFDELSIFFERPINLNKKGMEEDLRKLVLLNDFQINHLSEHIKKNGALMSIYELQAVPGFDLQTIRSIMPFVAVNTNFESPHTGAKELFANATNELFVRYSRVLEDQKGYADITDEDWLASRNRVYLGSQDRIYTRYRFKYLTNLSIGFTAEKDAGETFLGNTRADELFGIKTQRGFDFYSAHFFIRNIGPIKALAIGDYQAQFGQGLAFWSGLAFGKTANIMTAKRSAIGLRPYSSVDENLFLRGAAVTLGVTKYIEFTAFGSRKNIDANATIVTDTATSNQEEVIVVSSFQNTGFHRTVSEYLNRNTLQETIAGGNLAFKTRKLRVGITGSHIFYGGDVQRNLVPYSQFQFNSRSNTVIGVDYNYIFKNFNFFGEAARSENGGTALLSGVIASLDPNFTFSAVYRNYSRDFQNLKSAGFAESSMAVNEKGLFMGIDARFNRVWSISGYFDQFEFPWMRYLTDRTGTYGYDGMLQLRFRPSRNLDMYVRVRDRQKPLNQAGSVQHIAQIVEVDQTNYRFNVIYKVSPAVRLQSRVEYTRYTRGEGGVEQGFLIFQDVNVNPLSSPWSFSYRYALFDTDGYNSRIYAFENDVLYFFTIPAYTDRGTRSYINVRYTFKKGLDLWVRYSRWHYNNRETIGSGLDEITGDTKSEIRLQLRLQF